MRRPTSEIEADRKRVALQLDNLNKEWVESWLAERGTKIGGLVTSTTWSKEPWLYKIVDASSYRICNDFTVSVWGRHVGKDGSLSETTYGLNSFEVAKELG